MPPRYNACIVFLHYVAVADLPSHVVHTYMKPEGCEIYMKPEGCEICTIQYVNM